MSNTTDTDKSQKHFVGNGYKPDKVVDKPNGKPQGGHIPERSEAKPTNPPKKR